MFASLATIILQNSFHLLMNSQIRKFGIKNFYVVCEGGKLQIIIFVGLGGPTS